MGYQEIRPFFGDPLSMEDNNFAGHRQVQVLAVQQRVGDGRRRNWDVVEVEGGRHSLEGVLQHSQSAVGQAGVESTGAVDQFQGHVVQLQLPEDLGLARRAQVDGHDVAGEQGDEGHLRLENDHRHWSAVKLGN